MDNISKMIEVRELKKDYGSVHAVRGISFDVEPGEIFGLLGPNGAGKSSTVRIMTTLSSPTSGSIRIAGYDVVRNPEKVRENIGYVAQFSGLDGLATGRENLVLQGRIMGLKDPELTKQVDYLLDLFQLTEVAGRLVKTYSGGTKRRLDLASSFIHYPKVVFLDEPTTGLDPESRVIVWRHIESLCLERGITILLTTHNMEEANRLAHRLMIIDKGQIVVSGTPEELRKSLQGDFVEVKLADPTQVDDARKILGKNPEVSMVLADGATLFCRVTDGARAVPGIVRVLEATGISILQLSIKYPSLEDVYLAATGHKYEAGATQFRWF